MAGQGLGQTRRGLTYFRSCGNSRASSDPNDSLEG